MRLWLVAALPTRGPRPGEPASADQLAVQVLCLLRWRHSEQLLQVLLAVLVRSNQGGIVAKAAVKVHLKAIDGLRRGFALQDPFAHLQRFWRLALSEVQFGQAQGPRDELLMQAFALGRDPQRAQVFQVFTTGKVDRLLVKADLLRRKRGSLRPGQVGFKCLHVVLVVGRRIQAVVLVLVENGFLPHRPPQAVHLVLEP